MTSTASDPAELARLLPGLAENIAVARSNYVEAYASMNETLRYDEAIRNIVDACELLLEDRKQVSLERDRARSEALFAAESFLVPKIEMATMGLRARVAELEAPPPAWTCTTCDTSGATADLADDGDGPVCPECRQARHLCVHGPAGWRVAGLLAAVEAKRAEAEAESIKQSHKSAERQDIADGWCEGLEDAARLITAHLGTPSPLDAAVAEVMAVDLAEELADVEPMEPVDYVEEIESIADDVRTGCNPRDVLLAIAAVALAGIQSFDATAPSVPAVAPAPEPLFYIWDTRSFVGDSIIWWRPKSSGYTINLEEAGQYTAAQCMGNRDTDRPVPVEIARSVGSTHVIADRLRKALDACDAPAPAAPKGDE